MRRKRQAAGAEIDGEALLSDVRSTDAEVRGEAVRSLCPCHVGWTAFERYVGVVLRAFGDSSRTVRAHALHVLTDAARMQLKEEFEYQLQEAESGCAASVRRVSDLKRGC
jgi:hypothetical protein